MTGTTPMKSPFCLLILLGIVLTAQCAWGGISLTTSAACHFSEKGIEVEVTVINVGSETAANVGITARLGKVMARSPAGSDLNPGGSLTERLLLETGLSLPGIYAVEVLVDFTDRSGRPFSAVAYGLLTYREAAAALVFPQPGRAVVKDEGALSFEVINVDPLPHRAVVRLVLPRELSAGEPVQIMTLSGRAKKTAVFDLKNFAALEGALYPVLAFVEYEEDGRHYVAVGESRVRVEGEARFFEKYQTALIVVAVLLLLIVIYIQIFRPSRNA
jgi:hypothetical protein